MMNERIGRPIGAQDTIVSTVILLAQPFRIRAPQQWKQFIAARAITIIVAFSSTWYPTVPT